MRIKSELYVSQDNVNWTVYVSDDPDSAVVLLAELAARYQYVQAVTVYLVEKGDEDAIFLPPPNSKP